MFLAAALGDLATYCVTSVQLALAFPDPATGFGGALVKFLSIFAITQVPLAVVEGILTVVVVNLLAQYSRDELSALSFLRGRSDAAEWVLLLMAAAIVVLPLM